jgi:2,5-diketo-D-gluconate reductase B
MSLVRSLEFLEVHGRHVPRLGLGTFQLTGTRCREAVAAALDLGYRHIDTAEAYGNEREIGAAIVAAGVPRDELFLTTKIWWENLSAEQVSDHLARSLERLQTDRVDLLLIHWPNAELPLEEPLVTMQRLQDEGRVALVGVSNFPPRLLEQAVARAPIACNQVEYHPFLAQDELLALARRHGHALTAYCPLARNAVAADPVIAGIAAEHGCTPAQVTLRWLLQQDPVVAIPKASSRQHLAENRGAFAVELSGVEMDAIAGRARGQRLVDPEFAPRWE